MARGGIPTSALHRTETQQTTTTTDRSAGPFTVASGHSCLGLKMPLTSVFPQTFLDANLWTFMWLSDQFSHLALLSAFSFDSVFSVSTCWPLKCIGCHRSGDVSRPRGESFIGMDKCCIELFSVIMVGAGVGHTTGIRRPSHRPAATWGS